MIDIFVDMSQIVDFKKSVDYVQEQRMAALTPAVDSSTVVIRDRISRGYLSDGSFMISKSNSKEGRYSKRWGNRRKKEGLRVDVINLSFSGKTIKEFKRLDDFAAYKDDTVIVGFKTDEADDIGSYNNAMFGGAYDYSDKEINEVFKDYLGNFGNELTNGL